MKKILSVLMLVVILTTIGANVVNAETIRFGDLKFELPEDVFEMSSSDEQLMYIGADKTGGFGYLIQKNDFADLVSPEIMATFFLASFEPENKKDLTVDYMDKDIDYVAYTFEKDNFYYATIFFKYKDYVYTIAGMADKSKSVAIDKLELLFDEMQYK
ncbi:MAG: hypothetical protein GYA87_05885 [Christensenellaceae bacterium]|nr:hypothetical protein [Christensenellaceae bacterium]